MRTLPALLLAVLLLGCSQATLPPADAPGPRPDGDGPGPGIDLPRAERSRDATPDGSGWPSTYVPPTEEHVLDGLRAGHPRLILLDSDLQALKAVIASDPTAKGYFDALKASGDKMLTQPVSQRVLVGPRLLAVSRTVLQRLYTLSLLHRLTGEAKYRDRAVAELKGVAAFSDWNPSHFLDVAEMTHAFAIGYDWLYASLSASERATIEKAIIDLGLTPGKAAYDAKAWWTTDPFNWNLVCNGGLAVGGLAVADLKPDLVRPLLYRNITNLPKALASYAPDGAWAEGPGYWGYATQYAVAAFASLRSALGTEFGLSSLPGVSRAGEFRLYAVGPTRRCFNFADCGETAAGGDEPRLFWLARRFDSPLLAWGARDAAGKSGSYGDLLWFDARGSAAELATLASDSWFHGADIVFLRAAWSDANGLWVGFKGGDNKANHSHLDLGTFVLDWSGERWAIDLGGDDYNLPGYFGAQRFTYYRLRTEGHNTLLVNSLNQDQKAAAPIILFKAVAASAYAIADLRAGYAPAGVKRAQRGMALLDGRARVLVEDELEAPQAVTVEWALHTRASVAVSGSKATLTQNGKTLVVQVLEPAGATLAASDVTVPAPQNPTTGVRKLRLALPAKVTSARISVLLLPSGTSGAGVTARPLKDWAVSGPTQ